MPIEGVERLVERWWGERLGRRAFVWVSHDPAQSGRMGARQVRVEAGRLVGVSP